jgi:hypothetical protein
MVPDLATGKLVYHPDAPNPNLEFLKKYGSGLDAASSAAATEALDLVVDIDTYHYLSVTVGECELSVRALNKNNVVIDSFELASTRC